MSHGWGGARRNAGRKSSVEIKHCQELMARACTDEDWVEIMQGLRDIAKGSEVERVRMRAAEILMRFRFARPKPEPLPSPEEEIEPIRIVEVIHDAENDNLQMEDIPFPEGAGIPDKYRWGNQGSELRVVIRPEDRRKVKQDSLPNTHEPSNVRDSSDTPDATESPSEPPVPRPTPVPARRPVPPTPTSSPGPRPYSRLRDRRRRRSI